VLVNGTKIKDNVYQATPQDVIFMDKKTKASIQSYEFTTTYQRTVKASKFQMYHCDVNTAAQARLAHTAIASIPEVAEKTHLISAYILSSGEIGWRDDHDHGLGHYLYKTMAEKELNNSICFMTREYGGSHIGKKRYEIIEKLTDDIIINIEIKPDKMGRTPFKIKPPAMTLAHHPTHEQWENPRKTKRANRQLNQNTEETGHGSGWSSHMSSHLTRKGNQQLNQHTEETGAGSGWSSHNDEQSDTQEGNKSKSDMDTQEDDLSPPPVKQDSLPPLPIKPPGQDQEEEISDSDINVDKTLELKALASATNGNGAATGASANACANGAAGASANTKENVIKPNIDKDKMDKPASS
jgi:hypothetical protein